MTESIQNEFATMCSDRATAPTRGSRQLDFWRFAAEQYGIWFDEEQWCELAELDDNVLIARRFLWRLSDPEVHELLCAIPDEFS